jgi:hypothetical protein
MTQHTEPLDYPLVKRSSEDITRLKFSAALCAPAWCDVSTLQPFCLQTKPQRQLRCHLWNPPRHLLQVVPMLHCFEWQFLQPVAALQTFPDVVHLICVGADVTSVDCAADASLTTPQRLSRNSCLNICI